jgi:eukaryotic-like serine/threonine-protein kinase
MSIVKFIKSRVFFKHLGLALLAVFLFFWITFRWLGCYTDHGETIPVPDFSNLKINDLDGFVEGKDVRYEIIDSIYDTKKAKGIVVRQDPEPDTRVKRNRTIYLYVTAVLPPMVEMPKLKDRSLRQASAMLETYGLRMDPKPKYVADQCANCVLEQLYKGKPIKPGTKIEKGSVIKLVVGKGLSSESVNVPYFIGMTYEQAMERLTEVSLSPGALTFDSKDTLRSRVYRQYPRFSRENTVNMGSGVDLFFTTDPDKIPMVADTTADTGD